MNTEEVHQFILDARTLVLCSSGPDGTPHPMPMWFALEGTDTIIMTTFRKSQKVKNIERDPRVCVMVEAGTTYETLKGVVLYGTAELVPGLEFVRSVMAQTAERYPASRSKKVTRGARDAAPKRIGIRVSAHRVVSWDHKKLGDIY